MIVLLTATTDIMVTIVCIFLRTTSLYPVTSNYDLIVSTATFPKIVEVVLVYSHPTQRMRSTVFTDEKLKGLVYCGLLLTYMH